MQEDSGYSFITNGRNGGRAVIHLFRRALMFIKRHGLKFALLCAPLLLIPVAMASQYPVRPLTLIVPFAPGAAADSLARIMAERMKTSLGQPIIVDNVTGAGGTIGLSRG